MDRSCNEAAKPDRRCELHSLYFCVFGGGGEACITSRDPKVGSCPFVLKTWKTSSFAKLAKSPKGKTSVDLLVEAIREKTNFQIACCAAHAEKDSVLEWKKVSALPQGRLTYDFMERSTSRDYDANWQKLEQSIAIFSQLKDPSTKTYNCSTAFAKLKIQGSNQIFYSDGGENGNEREFFLGKRKLSESCHSLDYPSRVIDMVADDTLCGPGLGCKWWGSSTLSAAEIKKMSETQSEPVCAPIAKEGERCAEDFFTGTPTCASPDRFHCSKKPGANFNSCVKFRELGESCDKEVDWCNPVHLQCSKKAKTCEPIPLEKISSSYCDTPFFTDFELPWWFVDDARFFSNSK